MCRALAAMMRSAGSLSAVNAQLDLAQLHHRHGQLAMARAALAGALELARSRQNPYLAGGVQIELSQLVLGEGHPAEALERAEDAVALERESASSAFINDALCTRGQALEAMGRDEDAERS
jgi:ATP/maltotriose-dependent transcriptional regulator MalT